MWYYSGGPKKVLEALETYYLKTNEHTQRFIKKKRFVSENHKTLVTILDLLTFLKQLTEGLLYL